MDGNYLFWFWRKQRERDEREARQRGGLTANQVRSWRVLGRAVCVLGGKRTSAAQLQLTLLGASKNIEGRELTYISSVLWTALPYSCVDQCLARKRLPPITLP